MRGRNPPFFFPPIPTPFCSPPLFCSHFYHPLLTYLTLLLVPASQ